MVTRVLMHRKKEYKDLEEQLYLKLKQRGKMDVRDFRKAFPEFNPDILRNLLGNMLNRYREKIYLLRMKYSTSKNIYYHRDYLHQGLDVLAIQELLLYQRKFIYNLIYQISNEEMLHNLKKILDSNQQLEEFISNYNYECDYNDKREHP